MIFNYLSDAIDLVLALMHPYDRISSTYSIYLPGLFLLLKYGPLPDAHSYLHIRCGHLRSDVADLEATALNHKVEVGVDVATGGLVKDLTLPLVRFLLLHQPPTLGSLFLHVGDVVQEVTRFLLQGRVVRVGGGLLLLGVVRGTQLRGRVLMVHWLTRGCLNLWLLL